ncbi:MAG: 30S ribosomal protein S7 [Candidatus Aenigmarchaeota archaeon]|nr:30S ribosomal protein S7 [Candidatus Aenigmarchaeota archaeon]
MARRKSTAERKKQRKKVEEAAKKKARTKKVSKEAKAEKLVKKIDFGFKLFNKWDTNVIVEDPGLAPYIDLTPRIIPRSAGIHQKKRFHKSKMHIVERLALHLLCTGHTGKRHRVTSGRFGGAFAQALSRVEKAMDIIEQKEKKNPIEVIVRAIENAAVHEEVTSYQIGSIMARSAVVTSPQRRIDKALRYMAQGAYKGAFRKNTTLEQALAKEILGAYHNEKECMAIREKERIEGEAAGAR